ncbi:hypothetical protein BJ170DRAFT_687488 [Xylariales sp. AK1849]|nr:hypothetical protein BJ170DRAFT_687488 [Xylariales sp. AK1849]
MCFSSEDTGYYETPRPAHGYGPQQGGNSQVPYYGDALADKKARRRARRRRNGAIAAAAGGAAAAAGGAAASSAAGTC